MLTGVLYKKLQTLMIVITTRRARARCDPRIVNRWNYRSLVFYTQIETIWSFAPLTWNLKDYFFAVASNWGGAWGSSSLCWSGLEGVSLISPFRFHYWFFSLSECWELQDFVCPMDLNNLELFLQWLFLAFQFFLWLCSIGWEAREYLRICNWIRKKLRDG